MTLPAYIAFRASAAHAESRAYALAGNEAMRVLWAERARQWEAGADTAYCREEVRVAFTPIGELCPW